MCVKNELHPTGANFVAPPLDPGVMIVFADNNWAVHVRQDLHLEATVLREHEHARLVPPLPVFAGISSLSAVQR